MIHSATCFDLLGSSSVWLPEHAKGRIAFVLWNISLRTITLTIPVFLEHVQFL